MTSYEPSQKPNSMEVEFTIRELTIFRDGSTHRGPVPSPPVPACPSPAFPDRQVASKDVPFDATAHGSTSSVRLFLPPLTSDSKNNNKKKKLPILIYFHGGAFAVGSTADPMFHDFLCKLAIHAQVLIASVDYRLAPENPLPAAYDDCFSGLVWVFNQQAATSSGLSAGEPWLVKHGDLSRVFLGGDSAGGNIVHNVAMQAAGQGSWTYNHERESQYNLRGMILGHPFFTCGRDRDAALPVNDAQMLKYCRISADHPSVNPFSSAAEGGVMTAAASSAGVRVATAALPPALVLVAELDFLKERGVAYYKGLLEAGKEAHLFVTPNEDHVFHFFTPNSPNVGPLLNAVSTFINQ